MNAFSSIAALLLSVLLLIAGNGLIGVLAPLQASLVGFSDLTIGLLGSAYFAGMLAGTLAAPAIVRRVGHIRAFSVFGALSIISVILMPGWQAPAPWMVCRGAFGFVFAGIYAVIELWINAKADNASRGALYSVYQLVAFVASAGGQLVLRGFAPGSFLPFSVAGAMLALGIVPLTMTSVDPPAQPKSIRLRLLWLVNLAPVSALGTLIAGFANGALFALGPVYALQIGMEPTSVPLFTAAIVAGSALGVYPAGRISDQMDRRLVIVAAMAAGAATEIALAALHFTGAPLILMGFLLGLTTYTLYTLAVSHANDRAKKQDMVAVSAGLLFIYCLGAIVSPALASLLMRAYGPGALFVQAALVHCVMVAFALRRLLVEPEKPRAAGATP